MREWTRMGDTLTTTDDQGRYWGIAFQSDLNNTRGDYRVTGPDYESTTHATEAEAKARITAILDSDPPR
jgi:hypothetical protein